MVGKEGFIPAGYMYKRITNNPEYFSKHKTIKDIYSVAGCISDFFIDYINFWKHNSHWLFDNPTVMQEIACSELVDLSSCWLFYYEVYELIFDEKNSVWLPLELDTSFITDVIAPTHKYFVGFDVVSFLAGNMPECSPLSCNDLASRIKVNTHCLFDTFLEAKNALEDGYFKNVEPGPYRIIAVYSINEDSFCKKMT